MLYLITATPGSGKSQYAIERFILDTIRENEAAIAAWKKKPNPDKPPPLRRQVYTNIKGMMRPDRVAKIQAMVGGLPILPSPDDWRDCPDGSMVIYDEAQQPHLFRATGKPGIPLKPGTKASEEIEDTRITSFDTHRHRGFDIVLITQETGLIHHWAKKFVGRHVDLERVAGAEMMTVREWGKVQSDPADYHARQAADTSVKMMHKTTWELYDSATVHTHKFEMPRGAKFAIRGFLLAGILLPAMFWAVGKFSTSDAEAAVAEEASKADPPLVESVLQPLNAGAASPVVQVGINGCAVGRHCRCWDDSGQVMPIDDARCRNLAEGIEPMPINLNRFQGAGGARELGASGGKGEASPAPSAAPGVRTSPASVGSPAQGHMQGRAPETLRASGG